MKKLCELVDIAVNNENCVVFKIKEEATMDLIALGCFKGNEDMLRMTKGRTPEITVFNKDGSNFSYHFGEGSTSVISDNLCQQRAMIRECAILDFGIVCDWSYMPNDVDFKRLIAMTMKVETMADAKRSVKLVSGGGRSGNIRVNDQGMALNVDIKDISAWFKDRGYVVNFPDFDFSKGLPCGTVYGGCKPIDNKAKDFTVKDISKERFAVLLDNTVSFLAKDYDNDKALYDFLYDEIGMSDDEIRVIGLGDYIQKDKSFDEKLADAIAHSKKIGPDDDGSGPNGGAGGAAAMERERVRD